MPCLFMAQLSKVLNYDNDHVTLSIRLCATVTSRSSIKTANEVSFWHGSFIRPVLHYNEIWVPAKMGGTSLWNFASNSGLKILPCGKSTVLSTKLVHGLAYDHTYDSGCRCATAGCTQYMLVDCNPLTPLLRFVLDLLYNLFLQLCSS